MSGLSSDAKIEQFVREFDCNANIESPSQSQTDLKAGEALLTDSSSTPIAPSFMRNKGAKDTCAFGDHLISEADVECEVFDYVLYELEYKKSPYSLAIALALIVARKLSASATAAHQTQPSNSDYTRPVISSSALYKESLNYLNEIITEWKANPKLAIEAAKDYSNYPYLTAVNAIKNSRRKMEDRNIIIHDLNKLLQLDTPKQYSYYAIFDGHAGVDAASYSAAHLHHNLVKSQAFLDGDIIGAFKEAFSVTDLHYLERSAREGKKSGSTALCALLEGKSKLYIAWLGDSQAILVKNGKPIEVMIPHKPEREDERKRIEDLGGFVVFVDTWRVNGTLAVSRAIGDPEHKPYISSDPDITEIEFDGDEDFLILACDGLWDQITPEEATTVVYEHVCENTSDDVEDVAESVATCLSKTAKIEGSGDNITTIVIFFKELSALRSTPFEPLSPRTKTVPTSDYQQNGQFNGFNPMDSQLSYSQFDNQFDMSYNVTQQWSSFSSDAMNTTKIEIDSVDLSSNNSNLSSNLNPFSDTTQFSQINIENTNNIPDLLDQPKNVVLETSFDSEASGEYYSTIVSSSDLKNYPSDDQSQQPFASFSDNTFVMKPNFGEISVTEVGSSNVNAAEEVAFQSDYIDGCTSFKENDDYGNYLIENTENIYIPTIEAVMADGNQSFSSNVDVNEEVIDTTCVEQISNQSETCFTGAAEDSNTAANIDQLNNGQQLFDFELQNSQIIENNENLSDSDATISQQILAESQHNIDIDQPFSITTAEIVEKFDEMALNRNDSFNANEEQSENVITIDTKHANDVIEENVVSDSEPLSMLTVDNIENSAVNEKVILETNLDSFNTETIEVPDLSEQREIDSESSILIEDSQPKIQDSDEPTILAEQSAKTEDIIDAKSVQEIEAELRDRRLLFGVDEDIVERFIEPITESEQNYDNMDQTDNLIVEEHEQEIPILPYNDSLIVDKPIENSTIIDLKPNEEINDLMSQHIDHSFSSEQIVDQLNFNSITDASFNESSLQLIDENDLKGDIETITEITSEAINEFELSCKQPFDAYESASKEETGAIVAENLIENVDNTVALQSTIEETEKLELISKTTESKTILKTESLKTSAKTSTTSAKTTSSNSKTVAASKAKPLSSVASKPTTATNRPKTASAATSRLTSSKPAINSTIAAKQAIAAKPKVETRLPASRAATTTTAPAKPLASRTAITKASDVKTANTKPIAPKPAVSATRVPATKVVSSRINTGRTSTASSTAAVPASASASTANSTVNKTSNSSVTRKPVGSAAPSRPKPNATTTLSASKGTVSASAVNGNSAKTATTTSTLKTVKSRIDTGRSATTSSNKTTPTPTNQSPEKKSIVTSRSAVKPIDDKSPQRDGKTIVPTKATNTSKTGVTNNISPKLRKSNPLNVPKPLKQELEDAVLLSKPRSEDLSSLNGSQSTPDAAEKAFILSKSESLGLSPLNNSNGHTSSYDSPVFEPNINSNCLSN